MINGIKEKTGVVNLSQFSIRGLVAYNLDFNLDFMSQSKIP